MEKAVHTKADQFTPLCVRVCACVRVFEGAYLGQFVTALVLVKRGHGGLRRRAVQPLGATLHGTFRRAALRDEQRQEPEELLRIVLEELLRRLGAWWREREGEGDEVFGTGFIKSDIKT